MANRFLGEATVEVEGERYTLRCDFNAMAAFEAESGKEALASFQAAETGGLTITDMRAMFWAMLQHHHPGTTIAQAGAIMSEDAAALQRAILDASPTAKEVGDAGNGKRRSSRKSKAV
ncbi:hypothetical protein T8T21_08445 [Limimaricola variabilis]|uniref:GTA-gp10 family protein n=1 Tax=Limimaricola variabilis TaxID=1492771 RepID=UPI002AC8C877|nr:GTA-gp10 family protein [Limimaricola variabilis]WPY93156.1 hypothetical protein T8T21_08445 [Limimaricola variabilis]